MTADLALVEKALLAACGADSVRQGSPSDALDGVVPAFVASPGDTAAASALLRAAAAHDLAVVARGSGSRLGWGVPPARCDLVVDTLRMDAVLEHAAGDLVARVQAGARMNHVLGVLAAAGQEIALDVPGTATVGGVVASGLCGPRRLRYGSPRDLLIGITIVRADGTVAKSGGKVVKNVAGYDLGKLFAGSAGTLGLITEATFRLHPLPAARSYVSTTFELGAGSSAIAGVVAAAASSPLVPSAVELRRHAPGGPVSVGVLLEGSVDGVEARASRMASLIGSPSASAGAGAVAVSGEPPAWWPGLISPDDETLIRVSFWVSALGAVLDVVDGAARETRVAPMVYGSAGAGVLYVSCGADASAAKFAALLRASLGASLHSGRGSVAVLAAPASVRSALAPDGGMAGAVPSLGLMRAVKDQFDPGHRMAPGRFPEGI